MITITDLDTSIKLADHQRSIEESKFLAGIVSIEVVEENYSRRDETYDLYCVARDAEGEEFETWVSFGRVRKLDNDYEVFVSDIYIER